MKSFLLAAVVLAGSAPCVMAAPALAAIAGKFILSINDVPEVREIFARFRLTAIATTYHLQASGAARAGELLVTNSDLPPMDSG